MKASRLILTLALGALVAACAGKFESDVARFHKLERPAGETIRIEPKDQANLGSLEFEQYASIVRGYLVDLGYRPTADNPDIVVKVDYSISDGEERIRSRPGYYSGFHSGFGFRRHSFFHSGFHYPHGFYGNQVYSYTVYTRRLEMDMVNAASGASLFEGRAVSQGRDPRLPEVMPFLVQAMFTNFPGESGVTHLVEIKLADGGNY